MASSNVVSLSELAVRYGRTPASVYKQLEKFERQGLIRTQRVAGQRLVDVEAFEQARSVSLADRERGARALDRLTEARVRKLNLESRRVELDIEKRLGNLIHTSKVGEAMARSAATIVRAINELPDYAHELKELAEYSEAAVRHELRQIAEDLRRIAGEALSTLTVESIDIVLPPEWAEDEGTDDEETKPVQDA